MEVAYEPEKWRKGENLPTAQGLVLGSIERAGKLYALVDTGDVHCLMIGAAGVGKTAHFLYPNIEYACACGMSFLTTETKGDQDCSHSVNCRILPLGEKTHYQCV